MAQQTAVDWLIEQIQDIKLEIVYSDKIHSVQIPTSIIEQAKQMEKEQIIETWKHGNLPTFLGRVLTAEEYYNETYNK